MFRATQVGAAVADILSAARSRRFGTRAAWAIALVGAGVGNLAHAQQASSGAPEALQVEEITVTGSRIKRTTDFDTANPTTVVDSSYLQNLNLVNAGDAVKQLPANLSNNTPRTTGNANFFIGSTIANLRGLNPYFGSRTLTLLNNRRFVPTNQGDGVDLNFIPSLMIDRIDIVTGGVSAAYGSGAIAGVENIFLTRKLEGGKVQVDYGQSGDSDGDDKHVGFAYGSGLFDGRAHFVVGYEYQDSDAIGCQNARDWCREGNGFYNNKPLNPTQSTQQPQFFLGKDVRANQINTNGVFYRTTPGLTQTTQADAAGTGVLPFNLDPNGGYVGAAQNFVSGGDGRPVYQYTNLSSPVKRNVGAGTFTYELTDTMNLSVDVSYGKVETTNITGATDAQNNRIYADNAFLTPALATARAAAVEGTNAFAQFNKDWTAQTDPHTDFTTEVKRAAIGLDGKFGDTTWSWDAYYQYGDTKREQYVADARRLTSYLMAIDAVKDTAGNVVCRVTRDGYASAAAQNTAYAGFSNTVGSQLAAGCVPLNPFGTGAISQAAHDYSFGALDEQLDYEQQVVAASASGDLISNGFGLGAGPIQGAIGVEYRTEKGVNQARQDVPDVVRRDYPTQYGESFAGDVDVTEGFVEANLPVLSDAAFAKKLEFNTAARISKYENQGKGPDFTSATRNIFTWKISSIWDPTDWLRLRGSQSRDSRSPNFRELYYQQVLSAGGPFSFCERPGTTPRDACNLDLRGNVNLNPEKTDTTTLGFVLTPKEWVPGLQFAVDYFRIDLQDSINQGSSRVLLDSCAYGAVPANCDPNAIQLQNPGDFTDIVTVVPRAYNGVGYVYKGVDITTSYLWQINDTNSINFRLLGTHMIDQRYQTLPNLPEYQLVGQTGTANNFLTDYQPSPKWLGNLTATYNHGPLSITGQGRFVGHGTFNYRGELANPDGSYTFPLTGQYLSGATLNVNRVPSYAVFGLSGSYEFENVGPAKNFQVFATIDNLFDRDPPIAAGNGANANGGTNPVYFDTFGRYYRLGVRTNF
jgi:outer membrane receptor protein involved in Fe transport